MLRIRKKQYWEKIIYSTFAFALILGQTSGVAMAAEGEPVTPQQVEQAATPQSDSVAIPPAEPLAQPPAVSPEPITQPAATTNTQGPTSTPGPTGQTGPTSPTGKIPTYAFDDAIQRWVPTNTASFSWNPSSGLYESPLYSYDSRVGWYHVIPSAQIKTTQAPLNIATSPSSEFGTTSQNSAAAALASLLGLTASNSNTGPDSQNNVVAAASTEALLQNLTNALINNIGNSIATSGDAVVDSNTNGGSATSGAAQVVENLFNLLNAAWSWANGGLSYFAQNLFGDYYGDIALNPESVEGGGGQIGSYNPNLTAGNSNTGPDSQNNIDLNGSNNLTVVNRPTGSINNNLNLLAQSGDASVTNNTNAGSATSGPSSVEVNILNLINSAINAGDSFFGLLNIFGDLNGDILFPDGFLNSVVGGSQSSSPGGAEATNTNTGSNSSNTIGLNSQNDTNISNSPAGHFNNNIHAAAHSGDAVVSGNTLAGSGSSGGASTENNLFNLFNTNLAGDNAVLVLVNVMGQWVGHIMNLPTSNGSTGALLAGNSTYSNGSAGPNSTNSIDVSSSNGLNVINSPVGSINNNINANAISGDATVSGNTNAGKASSGNAAVSTNIANIFGSQFNLNRWFGVLVINVFGNWTGSVADDTSAGENGSSNLYTTQTNANRVESTTSSSSTSTRSQIGEDQNITSENSQGNSSIQNSENVETKATLSGVQRAAFAAAVNRQLESKKASESVGLLTGLAALTLLLAGASLQLRRKLMS